MHTSYLGIGSNTADAESMIEKACLLLASKGCDMIASSDIYEVSSPYRNLVAHINCQHTFEQLRFLTKSIEKDMGRTPEMKTIGKVPIDIDVVIFDSAVIKEKDYAAEYFARGYKQLQ